MWRAWERISQQPQAFYLHSWRHTYALDTNLIWEFEGYKQQGTETKKLFWWKTGLCRLSVGCGKKVRMKWYFKTKQSIGKIDYWMNMISPGYFREATTSPAFTPHQQQWLLPRCTFSKGRSCSAETEKGDCSPGWSPRQTKRPCAALVTGVGASFCISRCLCQMFRSLSGQAVICS